MKEIDDMLGHWIHNSIIRAKLRELIVKENFKSFDLGVEYSKQTKQIKYEKEVDHRIRLRNKQGISIPSNNKQAC